MCARLVVGCWLLAKLFDGIQRLEQGRGGRFSSGGALSMVGGCMMAKQKKGDAITVRAPTYCGICFFFHL
jgi:hypothetical protein